MPRATNQRMTIAQRNAMDPDAIKYRKMKQEKERAKLAAAQAKQAADQKAAAQAAEKAQRSPGDQITGRGAKTIQENIGERATGVGRLLKKFGIGS